VQPQKFCPKKQIFLGKFSIGKIGSVLSKFFWGVNFYQDQIYIFEKSVKRRVFTPFAIFEEKFSSLRRNNE
jgi:hypothetical protein